MAERAWFWVLSASCRSAARCVRKASTSDAPMFLGCLLWWNKMNRMTQAAYASSVRTLVWSNRVLARSRSSNLGGEVRGVRTFVVDSHGMCGEDATALGISRISV